MNIGFLIIPIDVHIFQRGSNHQPAICFNLRENKLDADSKSISGEPGPMGETSRVCVVLAGVVRPWVGGGSQALRNSLRMESLLGHLWCSMMAMLDNWRVSAIIIFSSFFPYETNGPTAPGVYFGSFGQTPSLGEQVSKRAFKAVSSPSPKTR